MAQGVPLGKALHNCTAGSIEIGYHTTRELGRYSGLTLKIDNWGGLLGLQYRIGLLTGTLVSYLPSWISRVWQ